MTVTTEQELIQRALPGYEVGAELGRGGWGVVLEGRHKQLGREVAIKQLPRTFASNPEVRERFVAEARLLASLNHPHLVPIYDYVEQDGICLLVMEKLTGGTVWARFTTEGLPPEATCAIVMATCAGLDHAHKRGVLHRDIKPENVLFSGDGVLKVTDFGIAKVVGGEETMATKEGEVLGTPAYMAPEQAQGLEPGPEVDVYATGVMLYELLSGSLPFSEEGDPLAILYKKVFEEPIDVRQVAPHLSDALGDAVMKAIATEPEARFRSVEQFGVAVAEAATATWGPGWLSRAQVPVMAPGPILAGAERPTQPGMAGAATAPPVAPAGPPLAPGEVPPPPPPMGATMAAAALPVRPTVASHVRSRAAADFSGGDLVPVYEVIDRPPPPRVHVLAALVFMVAAVVVAFTGLGTPEFEGDLAPGQATVAGADPTAATTLTLDLEQPVPVRFAQLPPAAAGASEVKAELKFTVLGGVPLGKASKPVVPGPDGVLGADIDLGNNAYFVASDVTGTLSLVAGTEVVAEQEFPVAAKRSPWISIPGGAAIFFLLFAFAYTEAILKPMRKGKRKGSGVVGLAIVGGLAGIVAMVFAWLLGLSQPVVPTAAAAGGLGALAGLAAGLAGLRAGKRWKLRPRQPVSARTTIAA